MKEPPQAATTKLISIKGYRNTIGHICKRNMTHIKRFVHGSDPKVPRRTTKHPSPTKQSASNRHPGQPATCEPVDKAIRHELAEARFVAHDLADHMFGHLVPLDLVKDILQEFISSGFVQVYEDASQDIENQKPALDPNSLAVSRAIEHAYDDAKQHACLRPGSGESTQGKRSEGLENGKEKKKKVAWHWKNLPDKMYEDDVVNFFNEVGDLAFDFAQPRLDPGICRRNRFAAPKDKRHAVPLPYEADCEDMRPDFALLPIEAFSEDMKTVDQRYVNFSVLRLVGELKRTNFRKGLAQVDRYARGIKRAQPWVYFVVSMTAAKERVALIRGEGCGTERIQMSLSCGQGCIAFIQVMLGLALASQEDLGHNPKVELKEMPVSVLAKSKTPAANDDIPSELTSVATASALLQTGLSQELSDSQSLSFSSAPAATDSHISDLALNVKSSSASKRSHDMVDHSVFDEEQLNSSKRLKVRHVECVAFVPVKVYGYVCMGIVFTSSSIRGRGTTVFCVYVDGKVCALKMSWQDLEREGEQNEVLEKLKHKLHPNIVVPRTFEDTRNGRPCTILETIRGLSPENISGFLVEDRILTISVSELKRPVKYFWGVHDFIRGIRGALLGHEHLTNIGILHRDISENNIVLGRRPEEERGYLIDFDMATLQGPQDLAEDTTEKCDRRNGDSLKSSSPIPPDESRPIKALRTGTTPYMSFNVLGGGRHTHYDDVESFLYVVLLFFFSYAGPLPKKDLLAADVQGFVQSVGSGRLSHMTLWPQTFVDWAEGSIRDLVSRKYRFLSNRGSRDLLRSPDVKQCMANNWPEEDLQRAINILLLRCLQLFVDGLVVSLDHTKVSHGQIIGLLDTWLEEFRDLEDKYSRCPF